MYNRGYRMDQSRKATAEDSWLSLTRAEGTRGHDCSWDPHLGGLFPGIPLECLPESKRATRWGDLTCLFTGSFLVLKVLGAR